MRLPLLALALASLTAAPEAARAAKICGLPSGDTLVTFNDSVATTEHESSKPLANALHVISSFPDIQALLRSSGATRVCVTGMAVSKNIYQYHEFLVVIEIEGETKRVLPMIFQAASIQAYENYVSKPWLGFARADLRRIVKDTVGHLSFTDNGAIESPLDLPLLPATQNADASSKSYVHIPDLEEGFETYLVSQLRSLDTGNPFTTQNLLDVAVVQVEKSSGLARSAPIPSFFAAYNEMLELQAKAQPRKPSERAGRLEELSR